MNPYIFGVCVALFVMASLKWSPEPSVDDMYPATRYERCMVLYGGTVDEKLCDKEKG